MSTVMKNIMNMNTMDTAIMTTMNIADVGIKKKKIAVCVDTIITTTTSMITMNIAPTNMTIMSISTMSTVPVGMIITITTSMIITDTVITSISTMNTVPVDTIITGIVMMTTMNIVPVDMTTTIITDTIIQAAGANIITAL